MGRGSRRWVVGMWGAMLLTATACGGDASPESRGPAGLGQGSSPVADPVVDRAPADSDDVGALVAGLNEVGYDLFGLAARNSDGDVVLSPLSIGLAFGMVDAGATGATAETLAELFAYPVEGEARWSAFNSLEQSVSDLSGPTVRLANRQFPDTAFSTAEGYDELLARWFGAGVEPLPLQAEPGASTERINQWVSQRTEQLIPELLPPGFVNAQSVLVLVNALYLQADWARPFGKYPTEDAEFTRLDGSTVTVPLMHELELDGPAVVTQDYAATHIPYEGDALSMLVIVPAAGRYDEMEARMGSDLIAEIDAAAATTTVELWLPRFDSDTHLDLRDAIENGLGVGGLFGEGGQWNGIAPDITLESAVHAADIAVDEIGTVAAAATALGFQQSGPPEPAVTVRADRPFLYLIRHQPSGAVLFVGRVLDPTD